MQGKDCLVKSVILLLVGCITAWYSDHLINQLFIFTIPIYMVLVICFAVLLVKSIARIIRRKEYINFATILVLALLACLIAFFPFRDVKVRYEVNRFEADRPQIIEMIKSGELRPKDNIGNVVLPGGYSRLSSDGEVFVYQNDKNGQVISFWVFRGMLDSPDVELIFSSGGDELIRASEGSFAKIERLKENWYYVVTEY